MIGVHHRLVRYHRSALILLALVLAMRALIPQGMMAVPDTMRGVAVLLCNGTGAAGRIDLPVSEKHGKAAQAEVCPFGVLANAAFSDTRENWSVAPLHPQPIMRHPVRIAFLLGTLARTHPPARAPPFAA